MWPVEGEREREGTRKTIIETKVFLCAGSPVCCVCIPICVCCLATAVSRGVPTAATGNQEAQAKGRPLPTPRENGVPLPEDDAKRTM